MTPTPEPATPARRRLEGGEPDSIVALLRQLMDDLSTLMRQEMALATAELSRSISTVKLAVASAATGAAVIFAGLLALLAAAVLGLTYVLVPWLATLVVGVAVTAAGAFLLAMARRRLQTGQLTPQRTQHSLRRDKEAIQRGSTS